MGKIDKLIGRTVYVFLHLKYKYLDKKYKKLYPKLMSTLKELAVMEGLGLWG